MNRNSTLKLLDDLFLREQYTQFDKSLYRILFEEQEGPKQETINTIVAYASSVKAIRIKSRDKVLISLN